MARASGGRCTWWGAMARSATRSAALLRPTTWSRRSRRTPVAAEFKGKVVLVTGVGRVGQIGHAIAKAFGEAGARLVLADVNAAALAERVKEFAAQQIEAVAAAGDLASPAGAKAAVAAAKDKFGGLDVVVNVAGGVGFVGGFFSPRPGRGGKEL